MNIIGFLRTQDGNIKGVVVVLLAMTILFLVARFVASKACKSGAIDALGQRSVTRTINLAFLAVTGLVVLLGFLNAASMFIDNRTPRSDVNRSGIYEQMNKN